MTLVTIGLPVYNGEQYLEKALEALCAQTFSDLEILISDNASTDRTPEIISKWSKIDSRIAYHRQNENIGAAANYKWVLNNARSPWYCFGAHDDLWSPDFIKNLYAEVKQSPQSQLIVPRMIVLREDGSQAREFLYPEKTSSYNSQILRIQNNIKISHDGWYYGLFKRYVLLESFENNKDYASVWGQDYIVLLPFILNDKITGTNQAIYYKRQTHLSDKRYRPKSGRDQCLMYFNALKHGLKIFRTSSLNIVQKFLIFPAFVYYIRKIQKPKRAFFAFIRQCLNFKAR